jgi:hypothetical protein
MLGPDGWYPQRREPCQPVSNSPSARSMNV